MHAFWCPCKGVALMLGSMFEGVHLPAPCSVAKFMPHETSILKTTK